MAEPVFLIQHWKKQQNTFTANLILLKSKSENNAIHDWRVSVKKLRSYLKLFFLILERKFDKDWLSKSEKLFRITGKLRDISMSQFLLDEAEKKNNVKYSSFKSYLNYSFTVTQKRTDLTIHSFDDNELLKAYEYILLELSNINDEKLQERTVDIIFKQIKKISELLKNFSQKNAHELRKLMKDLLYWATISPFPVPNITDRLNNLGNITDKFGNWQDMNVFLTKIKYFRSDLLPKKTEEYLLYKTLEKRLKKKNKVHLQKAEKAAKDFFTESIQKKPE